MIYMAGCSHTCILVFCMAQYFQCIDVRRMVKYINRDVPDYDLYGR